MLLLAMHDAITHEAEAFLARQERYFAEKYGHSLSPDVRITLRAGYCEAAERFYYCGLADGDAYRLRKVWGALGLVQEEVEL